jgi:hypothetical protein
VSQGNAVDILQVSSHREPSGQAGYPHIYSSQQLLDVGGCNFAFHRRVGCQDNLANSALAHPLDQPVEAQRFGADAIQGRESPAQDVILPFKVSRAIDDSHRGRLFHDTHQGPIPTRVATDGARLLLGKVTALLTGTDPLADGRENRGKPLSLFGRLLEQMKCEPLGRLPAYPREPGKFGNQLLDCAHRSEGRCKRQLRDLPHFRLEHLRRAPLSLSHRGKHKLAQELGITVLEDVGVDGHGADGATAIGRDFDHAAAGGRFNGARSQLGLELLKPALYLLSQLEQLLEICHAIG